MIVLVGACALQLMTLLSAPGQPVSAAEFGDGSPKQLVFFGRDRERIRDNGFLETPAIVGAQLKYTWPELEPERDRYELEPLLEDLRFLARHGKRLFVQVQDVSFSPEIINVPDYLREDPAFGGGIAAQYAIDGDDETTARPGGWVARRWDPAVRDRFARLLQAMGRALDGKIEGITLPETAVEFGTSGALFPAGYGHERYVEAVKSQMTAAAGAFPKSHVIQYANFMPGEWRPWDDKGYLESVYAHAARIGVGVGGPDLMPYRKGQQNHCLALIHGRGPGIVAGLAVQAGNLAERNPETGRLVSVAELYEYARDRLRLDYLFWGIQEPHYSDEILPFLQNAD